MLQIQEISIIIATQRIWCGLLLLLGSVNLPFKEEVTWKRFPPSVEPPNALLNLFL